MAENLLRKSEHVIQCHIEAMRRLKTKRVVWMIAILLALSFVAGKLLHKPDQPKIIGKLSQDDVSEISKVARTKERSLVKSDFRTGVRQRDSQWVIGAAREYALARLLLIETTDEKTVHVFFGTGTNKIQADYVIVKNKGHWEYTSSATYHAGISFTEIAPVR